MKKFLLLTILSAMFVSGAQAYRGDNHRGPRRPQRPVVVEKHHHHTGPDWLGPALILGTTVEILSQQREKEVVIVREPEYRTREISERIKGDSAYFDIQRIFYSFNNHRRRD